MKTCLESPQTEIVRLFCLGCTSKEVSAILDLALSKVDNHKAAAMQALGADDTQLCDLANQHLITKQNDGLTNREQKLCGRTR